MSIPITAIIFGTFLLLLYLLEAFGGRGDHAASVTDIEEHMDETEEIMSRTEHKTRIMISTDDDDEDEDF